MPEQATTSLPLFPIQLRKVDIGQLAYDCQGFSDSTVAPATEFSVNVAVSPFNETERTFQVTLAFRCEGKPGDPYPHKYSLMMALHGEFLVGDITRLNLGPDGITRWGERNGALLLMSFLREAVYTFTQKTGFKPLLIPLVETSAFKVSSPNPNANARSSTQASPQQGILSSP